MSDWIESFKTFLHFELENGEEERVGKKIEEGGKN